MEITPRIHSIPAQVPFYAGLLAPNVFLVTDGGVGALFDSGFGDEGSVRARLEYLREKQIDLRYIILSHHHFDHSSGAHQLRQATGAQVVLHPQEERLLLDWESEVPQDVDAPSAWQEVVERFRRFRRLAADAVPDLRLGDSETLRVGELTLQVAHTPGHTHGSICVYVRSRSLAGLF